MVVAFFGLRFGFCGFVGTEKNTEGGERVRNEKKRARAEREK